MPTLNATRGLVTSNSEINRPEGSLSVADNVVVDFDNVIQSRRGFEEYSAAAFSSSPKQLFTYKNRILAHYAQKLSFDSTGTGVFSDFTGSFSELVNGLRVRAVEANGNLYFTSLNGIKKVSAKTTAELATLAITNAGGIKAIDLQGKLIPDSSGFLPAQSKVAYRLVYGTKDANSNLILGYPSSRVVLTNSASDSSQSEIFTVNFLNYAAIANSDYILFDTPSNGYFCYFDKTGAATAPINADTLDREGIKIDIQAATTNNEAAALFANQIQSALPTEISIELTSAEVQITVTETGECPDASQGSLLTSEVLVTKILDGSHTTGATSLAELTFTLPESITTDYFYQVYRTGVTTVETGLTLSDIDPGDEQQFVFEAPITSGDIIAQEITVQDNTPETFRQSGAYLMTNQFSGGGITQANERPPIATDIALFRNSTFYANTKEVHRTNLSILSVDDFVSNSTKLYISQGASTSEYLFVGDVEVTDLTVDTKSNTIAGSSILINSANDERAYYLWFDKDSVNKVIDTNGDVDSALDQISVTAHGLSAGEAVTFTGTNFGATVNVIGPTFYVDIVDAHTIQIFSDAALTTLIQLASVAGSATLSRPSVDPAITGKLGIRVPLHLYPNTIAGTREAINDALSLNIDFTSADQSTNAVRITCTDAGFVTNPTMGPIAPGGAWAVNVVTQGAGEDASTNKALLSVSSSIGTSIDLTARSLVRVINKDSDSPVFATYLSGSDDLPGKILLEAKDLEDVDFYVAISDASLSAEFSPEVPFWNEVSAFPITLVSDNNENPNRIYFSKVLQPEAVPVVNYIDVGSKDKKILRILALRDNLFVLKQDGVYIVTGASAPDFSVRLLDNSATLTAPDTAVVLNNLIFCLTSQGVVSISETGVSIVGRQIEDQIKKVTTFNYAFSTVSFGVAYESDRSYLLWLPTLKSDTVATQCFRYNTITSTWTRWTLTNTCGLVNPDDDRMYLGNGNSRLYIVQERKDGERQDYADRSFTRSIGVDAFSNETDIKISSTVDVEIGDVIVQTQYLTVSKFNRMLTKLDRDTGPADNDYRETLEVGVGANLANALLALVAKLNADINLGTFTTPSGSNVITTLQADYNVLIGELNGLSSGTNFKTYKTVTDLITYEVLVQAVIPSINTVTVNFVPWITQGNIQIYKGIHTEVQWAAQHFGAPESTKQVDKGTLIFDQGTIYGGTIAYSSDRSADFQEIAFTLSGPGFWASYPWADTVWGGGSSEVPVITLIPRDKSRCRYLHVKFKHVNAREQFKLLGISLEPREVSKRGYR